MIILKGSPKGISVSVDDTDFDTGRAELVEKLSASKEFFKDIALEVFLTSNSLTEAEVYLLQPAVREALCETDVTFIETEPKMIPKKPLMMPLARPVTKESSHVAALPTKFLMRVPD